MRDERITKINELLSVLRTEVPGTKGSFIMTTDGFLIASDLKDEYKIDHYDIGNLFLSLLEKGENFAEKILKLPVLRYSLWSKNGDIQVFPLNKTILLIIISDSGSRPGLLLLRVSKLIDILKMIINSNDK